jgi:hypothetical protein
MLQIEQYAGPVAAHWLRAGAVRTENSATASDLPLRMNLARFDLVTMRLVVLCAESGRLAAAARNAYMSKSTASHRLTELELSLGTPLFMRDHHGLHPTQAGLVFVKHSRSILSEMDQLGHGLALFTRRPSHGS